MRQNSYQPHIQLSRAGSRLYVETIMLKAQAYDRFWHIALRPFLGQILLFIVVA